MYVRQMHNSDEEWLLSQLDEFDIDDAGFRSRNYVLAIDSEGEEAGFGRVFRYTEDDRYVRFAHVTVFDGYDVGRVTGMLYQSLFEKAFDYECDTAYLVAEDAPDVSFEFEACDPETVEVSFDLGDDETLFVAEVYEALGEKTEAEKLQDLADEFGYNENTTTKYSVN